APSASSAPSPTSVPDGSPPAPPEPVPDGPVGDPAPGDPPGPEPEPPSPDPPGLEPPEPGPPGGLGSASTAPHCGALGTGSTFHTRSAARTASPIVCPTSPSSRICDSGTRACQRVSGPPSTERKTSYRPAPEPSSVEVHRTVAPAGVVAPAWTAVRGASR